MVEINPIEMLRSSLEWVGDLLRKPACPVCNGYKKVRCTKYCHLGYIDAEVGAHTSVVPLEDFDIIYPNNNYKSNASIRIKRATIQNSGRRKGTYLQIITVRSLGEEIGRYDSKLELRPTERKEISEIEFELPRFLWLRNEMLEREPSKADLEVEFIFKVLDKGEKCDSCKDGFIKCPQCTKG